MLNTWTHRNTKQDNCMFFKIHNLFLQAGFYSEDSDQPECVSVSDRSSRMYGISSILRNTESLGLFWPSDLLPVAQTRPQSHHLKAMCIHHSSNIAICSSGLDLNLNQRSPNLLPWGTKSSNWTHLEATIVFFIYL